VAGGVDVVATGRWYIVCLAGRFTAAGWPTCACLAALFCFVLKAFCACGGGLRHSWRVTTVIS